MKLISSMTMITVLSLTSLCQHAAALVVDGDPLPKPMNGFVGNWRSASGVPIGERFVLTAQHIGGDVNSRFRIDGVAHGVRAIHRHPTVDLMIVELNEALPGWHRVCPGATTNLEVVVGGMGYTSGESFPHGVAWSAQRRETWGRNRLISVQEQAMMFRFDAPGQQTPHECSAALYDSGAGIFLQNESGGLELIGIIISVTSASGFSAYGDITFALNLSTHIAWIESIVGSEQAECPSDLNDDGIVHIGDLNLVLGSLGQDAPAGDVDGDGDTDLSDLIRLLNDYGMVCQ